MSNMEFMIIGWLDWLYWLTGTIQANQCQQPSQPNARCNSLIINTKANQANQANNTIIMYVYMVITHTHILYRERVAGLACSEWRQKT